MKTDKIMILILFTIKILQSGSVRDQGMQIDLGQVKNTCRNAV